eukprot:scaffold3882_cov110-Isochrysis_galbana.AAC.3
MAPMSGANLSKRTARGRQNIPHRRTRIPKAHSMGMRSEDCMKSNASSKNWVPELGTTGSAEPALFKPTELTPTRDPINHPYTVGCALSTALKQALSRPKQPTSSRTASDSVKRFLLTAPWLHTPCPTFRARSTRTSEKPQMTLGPLEAFETNLFNEPKELSSPPA